MPQQEEINGLLQTIQTLIADYALGVLGAIVLFVAGLWLAGVIRRNLRRALTAAKIEPTLVSFFTNFTYYAVLGLVVGAALISAGVSAAAITAALGTIGLAVGLALQGSLANFAAGVIILLTKPFRVGDLVEIASMFGYVEEIQIIHTIILTLDNKTVTIPNANITSDAIVNYSKKGVLRVDMVFGIG
ncbi:MAG: mechanosensitive ion channel family protein, partial [Anaerolineae bacterium]